jgi:hypothetical protein
MTLVEKVERYLRTHKSPVSVQQLSARFLVSESGVRNALIKLEQANIAQHVAIRQQQFWSIVRHPPAVAVSDTPDPPKRPTSYPHARGYDD